MTELSFLIELLLEHELKADTKKAIATRIKEVEGALQSVRIGPGYFSPEGLVPISQAPFQVSPVASGPVQAPSTLALMAKHNMMPPQEPAPLPIEAVAQTPATAAALAARAEAMMGGKGQKSIYKARPK